MTFPTEQMEWKMTEIPVKYDFVNKELPYRYLHKRMDSSFLRFFLSNGIGLIKPKGKTDLRFTSI